VVLNYCGAYPTPNTTGNGYNRPAGASGQNATSTLDWKPGFATLTAVTGYRHTVSDDVEGIGGIPYPIIDVHLIEDDATEWSQEVRLTSTEGGALTFGDKLSWIAGLYYYNESFTQNRDINILNAVKLVDDNAGVTKSEAAFISGSYKFTESLSATVGGRYTHDDKHHNFFGPTTPVRLYQQADFHNFSPEGTLQYAFDKERMVYVRYAEGYRGGGFDGQPPPTHLEPFLPETVKSYEIGAKTQWLDNRLRINVDAYTSKYKDLQRQVSINGTTLITQNAASGTTQGVELETIFLLTKQLKFNLSMAYLDAKYDLFYGDVLGNGMSQNLSWMRFNFAPKWSGVLSSEYEVPIAALGRAVFNVQYNYSTSQNLNIVESPESGQPSYGLLGASVTFHDPKNRYFLSLYGRNVLNKQYRVDFEPVSGLASVVIDGMPATWGISVGVNF
jgi:iron complex outermembrane receptor protein